MKDDIKQILRDLEFASGVFDYTITPNRCTFLKDYITNLQQENERLKQDYINLKNCIVLRKVDSEVQYKATLYNIELENINKKRYEDYKSRCEKANAYMDYYWISYEDSKEDKNYEDKLEVLVKEINDLYCILNDKE